jgi:hypothetical protein
MNISHGRYLCLLTVDDVTMSSSYITMFLIDARISRPSFREKKPVTLVY